METPLKNRLQEIEDRLDKGAKNMRDMRTELADNTAVTTEVKQLLEAGKNGLKVLGWIGVGAKWVGGLAAAITALWTLLYAATHGGHLPK